MKLFLLAANLILLPSVSLAGGYVTKAYPADGYSIDVPTTWTERMIGAPTGNQIRAFMDTGNKNAAGYCQVEVIALDKKRMPRMASMSEAKRREFFSQRLSLSEWLQIYPSLASSPGFQLINSFPVEIAGQTPAGAMEFRFHPPQAYDYHVRATVTFNKQRIYSLWCLAIGRGSSDADINFNRYLPEFITVASKFKPLN